MHTETGKNPRGKWNRMVFWIADLVKPKVGAILKKSVDWSDTDVILSEESIDKAIVLLQIPEVLNDETIQVLLWKTFWIGKAIV